MIVIPGFKYLTVAAGALAGQLQFAGTNTVTSDIYGTRLKTRTSLAQQYERAPTVRDLRKISRTSHKPHHHGRITLGLSQ